MAEGASAAIESEKVRSRSQGIDFIGRWPLLLSDVVRLGADCLDDLW